MVNEVSVDDQLLPKGDYPRKRLEFSKGGSNADHKIQGFVHTMGRDKVLCRVAVAKRAGKTGRYVV
jgi:hypothetical protein